MFYFIDVLRRYSIPYRTEGHEHCREGWVQIDCPWCSTNSLHFRLGYNLGGGYFHCWACGPHNVVKTLCEITSRPPAEIGPLVEGVIPERSTVRDEVRGMLRLPNGVRPLMAMHREYLKSRGFDPDEIVDIWKVRAIGYDVERLKWRLFIPVIFDGETVSWLARRATDGIRHSRYMSARASEEKINRREILYGEDFCKHTIIVNEGPLDAWTIGPGAVATLGTGYSRAQVLRIARFPVRVIVFDNEPAAQKRAHTLVSQLEPFPGQTYNVCLSGKDASRSPPEEIDKLRKQFLGPSA